MGMECIHLRLGSATRPVIRFRGALVVTAQSAQGELEQLSIMRRQTKLLTCALVGITVFSLLHSDSVRQKTISLLEPVHLDLLNHKDSLNAVASEGNIMQKSSVYDETVERSATEIKSQLGGDDNSTRIKNQSIETVAQIKDGSIAVTQIKDQGTGDKPRIMDHSVEDVTQIQDHMEAVTQRAQQGVSQARDQGVEALTQTKGQGEVPVTQFKLRDVTRIKEGKQIHTGKNFTPSTVRSVNTLQPFNTSAAMHQTTRQPLSLLSSLHAPPSFPWLQGEIQSNPERVMQFEWIKDLKSFLISVDVRFPITIVTSDSHYEDALLNWLIMSTVTLEDPIKNTLILSLDSSLHQILQNKSIKSLHILPSPLAVVEPNRFRPLKQVEVVRLTAMRLLNYWGFDVANYDSDAMIVKNPQPIYDRYSDQDVIGSAGYFPPEIHRKWGVTLCMGAVMIRATKQTGTLLNYP